MSDLILELGSVIAMNNRPPVIAVFFRKLRAGDIGRGSCRFP